MSEVDTEASALLARYWDALSADTRADIGEILNPDGSPPQPVSGTGPTRGRPAIWTATCSVHTTAGTKRRTSRSCTARAMRGRVTGQPGADYVYLMVSAAEAARSSYGTMGFAAPGVRTRIVVNPWMARDCGGVAVPPLPGTPPVILFVEDLVENRAACEPTRQPPTRRSWCSVPTPPKTKSTTCSTPEPWPI
jgi:hypothetical protein